ncbi:MAG: TonB family protein, partial [Methylocystis sp.]
MSSSAENLQVNEHASGSERPADYPKRSSPPRASVQPPWLRPVVTTVVFAVHVAVFAWLSFVFFEQITPVNDVSVELIPEGEVVTETSVTPTPDAAPIIADARSLATSPDPMAKDDAAEASAQAKIAAAEVFQDLAAPAPKIMAPDPVPLPLKAKDLHKKLMSWREERERDKRAAEDRESRRAATRYDLKREQAHAPRQAAHTQFGAAARRAGVRGGSAQTNHMSNSAYAARVSAEINRHKFYPAGARGGGAAGSVGVAFSIGPSGAIVSHSVVRSSGNGALDFA